MSIRPGRATVLTTAATATRNPPNVVPRFPLDRSFVPRHLAVLTLRDALIEEIDAFSDPSAPLLGTAGDG
jgi:hypothetical protein